MEKPWIYFPAENIMNFTIESYFIFHKVTDVTGFILWTEIELQLMHWRNVCNSERKRQTIEQEIEIQIENDGVGGQTFGTLKTFGLEKTGKKCDSKVGQRLWSKCFFGYCCCFCSNSSIWLDVGTMVVKAGNDFGTEQNKIQRDNFLLPINFCLSTFSGFVDKQNVKF